VGALADVRSAALSVSLDHYESSVAALLSVGAIVDRRNVYWDIRLSEHQPILEFRSATSPSLRPRPPCWPR
jgi:gamma-glutamyl:cysteine ligase YbdK (ATP-grasp superfamily)